MSKQAEEAAKKAYPNVEQPVWDKSYPKTLFVRHTERNAFIKGYEQAERDHALTWEDIKLICEIEDRYWNEKFDENSKRTTQEYYEGVLRRFLESKEEKAE